MKIPESVSAESEGQYCLACLSKAVERISRHGRTYYTCTVCGKVLERSLVIDNGIKWWMDADRTFWHESAGVVVVDEKEKILCVERKIFPFAYSLPAGHVDIGEDPKDAACRELEEETRIRCDPALVKHLVDMRIESDSCRRGSDHHVWHLYQYKMQDKPQVVVSDEIAKVRWANLEELKSLTPLADPFAHIIATLGSRLVE